MEVHFSGMDARRPDAIAALRGLLPSLARPFVPGGSVGIKLHWGEIGNESYLEPVYAREIAGWLTGGGYRPFVFDTSVLYSGGRRTAKDALETAARHGFTEAFLGCPVVIADGMDGRDVVDLPAGYKHFETVQVADIVSKTDGFVIFSHFKGHLASGFGGAIKNLSMGFASRAQKQRMHADVKPALKEKKCIQCGICVDVCPSGAARMEAGAYPTFDLAACIGCAQCIAQCPELALKILWGGDHEVFQEKLVETAAAVWRAIAGRTVLINALIRISAECDCLPGKAEIIAADLGFTGGADPVALDADSVSRVGAEVIARAHPALNWQVQFAHARAIGFGDAGTSAIPGRRR